MDPNFFNTGKFFGQLFFGNVSAKGNKIGGLIGLNDAIVSHSTGSGSVSGNSSVGGLIGENTGNIYSSYAFSDVFGATSTGGFTGLNVGTIFRSMTAGTVSGDDVVGGFIGLNDGTVSICSTNVNVFGDTSVGGFVGELDSSGIIQNSFAKGASTGVSSVGGLIGAMAETSQLVNSYAIVKVEATGNAGGLVASGDISGVVDSYYDIMVSFHEDESFGKITVELLNNVTLYADWDTFAWKIEADSYPVFQNFNGSKFVFTQLTKELTFFYGDRGGFLTWMGFSTESLFGNFTIFENGTMVEQIDNWLLAEPVNYLLGDLSVGLFNFTILGSDESGNQAGSSIFVTILPTPPELTEPGVRTVFRGNVTDQITWTVFDIEDLGTANLYVNGSLVLNRSWTSGEIIIYFLDELTEGSYNVTLVVVDSYGLKASDTVIIEVLVPEVPHFYEIQIFIVIVNLVFLCSLISLGTIFLRRYVKKLE